jgi:excisionase family DNA binding protein
MTVKELAEELGVSKPTISKAITELGLQGHLTKIGNRFILEDSEIEAIKSKISQTPTTKESPKSESENKTETKETQNETEKSLISLLESQITILSEQLSQKDSQINALTSALATSQEQIKALTDSLQATTSALTTAQALHAGTIQQQLKSGDSECSADTKTNNVVKPKRNIWQRLFDRE